jgi:hypothetical protein
MAQEREIVKDLSRTRECEAFNFSIELDDLTSVTNLTNSCRDHSLSGGRSARRGQPALPP